MNYYKGNFYEDREKEKEVRNGWLVGRFMSGVRKTEEMAIKFWKFQKGEEKGHFKKHENGAIESTFVLKGKVRGIIDGAEVILQSGDYVVIPAGIVSNTIVEVLEEPAEGLTIKAPSLPKEDSIKHSD